MAKMNSSSRVPKSIADVCKVVSLDELITIISNRREGDINILVTGDCHLAVRSLEPGKVAGVLNEITSDRVLRYTDSVVLNGDLLDRRISLASEEAVEFIEFGLGLRNRCRKHGVSLDILEGTPSHDNRQPAILELFDRYAMDQDRSVIRYIDRVSIVPLLHAHRDEYVQQHYGRQLHSLFVPDEVSTDGMITWGIVKDAMSLTALETVDMSYMHGTFRYQEPILTEGSHVEEHYEGITRGRVVVNHWHLPSAHGRIRAPGSVERLRHGEEETKGFYYITLSPGENGDISVTEYFVYNENATEFVTMDVSGLTLSSARELLDATFERNPKARVRLQLSRLDELYPSLSDLRMTYKSLKITEKIIDIEVSEELDLESIQTDATYSIRPDNLSDLIIERLADQSDEVRKRSAEILGEETCQQKI